MTLRRKHTLERFLFAFVNCEIKIFPAEVAPFGEGFTVPSHSKWPLGPSPHFPLWDQVLNSYSVCMVVEGG